jgi:ribonuclease J
VATVGSSNGVPESRSELISRGLTEPGPLLDEMQSEADRVLGDLLRQNVTEIKLLQEHLHDSIAQLIYDRTGRRPMILPVIVEV